MTRRNWSAIAIMGCTLGCGSSSNSNTSVANDSGLGGSSAATGGVSAGGATNGTATTGGRAVVTTGGATANAGGAAGGADCSPSSGAISCNAPIACGAFVTSVNGGTQPVALGGTIVDGTYELTQLVFYNGSGAGQLRVTKVISQGSITSTVVDQSSSPPTMSSGSYTTSGNTLNWNITCPSAAPDTYTYTASGNLLILYHANGPAVLATIYTRQGA